MGADKASKAESQCVARRSHRDPNIMNIFVAGVSYRTAPVEVREKLSVPPARLRCVACRLKVEVGLSEVVLLSTCNRVEIYGVTDADHPPVKDIFDRVASSPVDYTPYLYLHKGNAAIDHLLSVTSGLDSMVLGETEITGQVKQAYLAAQDARLTGKVLNRLFQKALQTAKKIRTGTQIGRGATSVGSVAVELAEHVFGGNLSGLNIMIFGAGKMGEACVRHLTKRGVQSVIVANRSFDRAQELAAIFGGRACRLDEAVTAMADADIVVSSTGSPHTVLHRADVEAAMAARPERPLVLIDIAVPRDIDAEVQSAPNVYLHNIDDLEAVVRENLKHRQEELMLCRKIIQEETAALMKRFCPKPDDTPHRWPGFMPAWTRTEIATCAT